MVRISFLFALLTIFSVLAAPVFAEPNAVAVGLQADDTPATLDEQWARVNRIVAVDREDFTKIREDHRGMLARMADTVTEIEASGGVALLPSVCFTADVPWETVSLFNEFTKRGQKFQGEDGDRWSQTFADGSGLQQGDTITLRVSFPADGISLLSGGSPGNGEPNTPNNLNASFDAGFGNRATWKALFQSVFDDWSARAGLTYVFDVSDDGAAFPTSAGSSGRGDVRITGHTIDGPGAGILAYNYFPNQGDMVIDTGNTNDAYAVASANNFRFLRNVVSHEHGHGMGFSHVCPLNSQIVMQPLINTAFDHSGEDDIRHANRKYGDPNERNGRNDSTASATSLGTLNVGAFAVGDYLSIDAFSDDDFYAVTTTAARRVQISLAPIGTQYQEGPQNTPSPSDTSGCGTSSLSTTNALAVMNLALEVLDSDGVTVLASSNTHPLGQAEDVTDVYLPANGTYFIHAFTNDGPSANPDTQVQMYALDLESAAAGGNLRIHSPRGTVEEFDVVTLTAIATDFATATYVWRKDGGVLPSVTGSELQFNPVALGDTGSYTVEADSGAKELVVSPPFYLEVVPAGSLPAFGVLGAVALGAALLGTGLRRQVRSRP